MRNRLVTALAAGALGIAAGACTIQPAAPYPDVSSFCTAKAKAICEASAICAIDPNLCQTNQVSKCSQDAQSAEGEGRTYQSGNAPNCIDSLKAAFGNNASQVPYAAWVGPGSLTDKCERVFAGKAGNNQPCSSDYDCSGNLICSSVAPGSTTTAKVCATLTMLAAQAYCGEPGQECAPDTYCAPPQTGAAAQCIPAAQSGQACSAAVPCVSSQRCDANTGTCSPRLPPGGMPCTADTDCSSIAPYCDIYANNRCTIGLTFATGAADCNGFLLGM